MASRKVFVNIVLCILVLATIKLSAQDSTNFFPHQVGDMWEYYFTDLIDDDTLQVFVITDSMDPEGNHHVTRIAFSINPLEPPWFFPDSATYVIDNMNQVLTYSSLCPDLFVKYKLDAQIGDQWVLCGEPGFFEITRVVEVRQDTIFGVPTVVKGYLDFFAADSTDTSGLELTYEELADGFGLIYGFGFEIGMWVFLRGAVLNGILYGDTTLVSIYPTLPHSIPEQFYLYQNYPNPFNPRTTIPFQLNKSGQISIKIYDVAGRLVRKLIDNQWYPIGEHEIIWDGKTQKGGDAASGIYFYQLIVRQQRATRPMLLIR